jgi:hypothetical protein
LFPHKKAGNKGDNHMTDPTNPLLTENEIAQKAEEARKQIEKQDQEQAEMTAKVLEDARKVNEAVQLDPLITPEDLSFLPGASDK